LRIGPLVYLVGRNSAAAVAAAAKIGRMILNNIMVR
jgi:hypothetical protein